MLLAAFASLVLASATAAQPLTEQDHADARCYLVFSELSAAPPTGSNFSADQKSGFHSISTYFLGKLKGRSPQLDLTALLTPYAIKEVHRNLRAEAGRCAPEAEASIAAIEQTTTLILEAERAP